MGFALVSLLPLMPALLALAVSRDWALARLHTARGWLERYASTIWAP
ncbi:MAG: hypothetical protein ACTHQQ_11875 [Solirubrobacteraceae bacterium]